jgi:dipeptidase
MPLYAGMTEVPKSFMVGDHWTFSRDSVRWAFDYTDFHVQVVYAEAIKDVQAAQAKYEGELVARIPEIDQQALALYKKKPAEAAKFLTGFGINNATTVTNAWWKLGDDLLVKYNRLYLYNVEKRGMVRGQPATPDWWKKAVRAFDILMEPVKK